MGMSYERYVKTMREGGMRPMTRAEWKKAKARDKKLTAPHKKFMETVWD